MSLAQPIAATILSLSLEKDALARFEMFKCLASVYDLITSVFSAHFDHLKILYIKGSSLVVVAEGMIMVYLIARGHRHGR
ncbi:hypothetical protein ACJWR0_25695, partial [Klebsiella pneumoniae]